jgi:NADH dehydrogenase/NADH:ubiquinone oxidoreductase subunit G
MTACTTRAKEGMVVTTESEVLFNLRRYVIDLLLSMHPLDCMTCPKASVCRLQEYAYDLGLKESSFTRKSFDFAVDKENPLIRRDPNYCVLCGRCVRVCKAQGTSVFDFQGRGVGSRVTTPDDLPLQDAGCTFCGSCVEVCPVNAILEAPNGHRGREWEYVKLPSVCLSCADACSTVVSVRQGRVEKINAGGAAEMGEGYICAYGRFGFDAVDSDTRVGTPLQRIDGELQPISWDEALAFVAAQCEDAGSVTTITAGNLFNEDLLTLRRLSESAGWEEPASVVGLYADEASLLGSSAEIGAADLVVLVGLAPSQWERVLPALDATLRRLVKKGAKLVIVNADETRIGQVAEVVITGDEAASLETLVEVLGKGTAVGSPEAQSADSVIAAQIVKLAELYMAAKRPLILAAPALYEACGNVSAIKGEVLSVPFEANARGTLMMGITGKPTVLIEGPAEDTHDTDVLYALGDLSFARPADVKVLIAQCTHMTDLAQEADLVLPASMAYEAQGTIVDYTGRLRALTPVVESHAASKGHRDILGAVAQRLGLNLEVARLEDVEAHIAKQRFEAPPSRPMKKRSDLIRDPRSPDLRLDAHTDHSPKLSWLKGVPPRYSDAL